MDGLWPDPEVLPEFRERMLVLEKANWDVGMRILRCFARKLGFPSTTSTRRMSGIRPNTSAPFA